MIRKINNAMAQRRAELKNGENDKGFTLIELMVVIIIIGILAAIAIPVFLNQRTSAWDASVKSDLSNVAIAAASYATDHNGSYANMTLDLLKAAPYSVTLGSDTTASAITASTTTYTMTAYSTNNTSSHTFTLKDGTITGPKAP